MDAEAAAKFILDGHATLILQMDSLVFVLQDVETLPIILSMKTVMTEITFLETAARQFVK